MQHSETIHPGDLVRKNDKSPVMRVIEIKNGIAHCIYSEGRGIHDAEEKIENLRLA